MRNETVLAKVAEWQHSGGRQTLTVSDSDSGWSAALTADRSDELGCKLWEVALRRPTPAESRPVGALRAWGEAAADRVTGLLEPLAFLEADAGRDEALLRSKSPGVRDGVRYYYEVRLRGAGEALVRRFRAPTDAERQREQVPFTLTQEALAKLVSDLAATF